MVIFSSNTVPFNRYQLVCLIPDWHFLCNYSIAGSMLFYYIKLNSRKLTFQNQFLLIVKFALEFIAVVLKNLGDSRKLTSAEIRFYLS